ncbi:MAG: hypothetical protein OSB67_08485 [Alphaproteobacteria bacterium]|nr:hypothetical protein [Alphaproteobacteria bacterium]
MEVGGPDLSGALRTATKFGIGFEADIFTLFADPDTNGVFQR